MKATIIRREAGGETGTFVVGAVHPTSTDWFFAQSPTSRRVALRLAGIDPDGKRRGYPRDGWDHDKAFRAVYGVDFPI